MIKKIDGHVHFYNPHEYDALKRRISRRGANPDFWLKGSGEKEEYKSIMIENGFSLCLNLPVATELKRFSIDQSVSLKNAFAMEIRDDTFKSLGALHPNQSGCPGHIKMLKKLGFRGIKLHPFQQHRDPTDDKMHEIYRALARNKMLLQLDTYGAKEVPEEHRASPDKIAKILKVHPDLTIILPHMAGLPWYGEDAVIKYLIDPKFENLYLDTSNTLKEFTLDDLPFLAGLQQEFENGGGDINSNIKATKKRYERFGVDQKILREIIKRLGAERIIFGSDWPYCFVEMEEEKVRGLGLTNRELDLIFCRNTARLLGLAA